MSAFSDPRENNFNILRLVSASAVIFSHATPITQGHHGVIKEWIGYDGGWMAVSAFFSISGMLIYLSIVRSRSIRDYLVARCLRIFPGLWAMLLISVVILGFGFSSMPPTQFFTDPQVGDYLSGNAILYVPQYFLPDVFASNPMEGVVNGSLWTLRFEFTCYLITLALFLIGAYRSDRHFFMMTAAVLFGYVGYLGLAAWQGDLYEALHDGSDIAKLHRLFLAFFLGIIMGRFMYQNRPSWWSVLIGLALCWLAYDTPLFATMLIVLIALALFWFAFLQHPLLRPFRAMPDYSYGIYIYAFPVQQVVVQMLPGAAPLTNALLSLAITLPFAALSWHFIEKPALGLKQKFSTKRMPE